MVTSRSTKAELLAELVALRAQLAATQTLEPCVPAASRVVRRDADGFYVRISWHASYAEALAVVRAAAIKFKAPVRLLA